MQEQNGNVIRQVSDPNGISSNESPQEVQERESKAQQQVASDLREAIRARGKTPRC